MVVDIMNFGSTQKKYTFHKRNSQVTFQEFEPRSWLGVLDTTLCDKFVSNLPQVGGFRGSYMFVVSERASYFYSHN
jgi:hypothetical protein